MASVLEHSQYFGRWTMGTLDHPPVQGPLLVTVTKLTPTYVVEWAKGRSWSGPSHFLSDALAATPLELTPVDQEGN